MKRHPGQAVRIRRKHLKLRIEQVAAAADISVAYAYALESGKHKNPSLAVAQRIAAALDCDMDLLWPPEATK